uniref:Uncharacterized protein n=1 Tax=Rhizophora mucronata TaxID=61149 RepID=A0A2P2PMI8_RHIMU
MVTSSTQGTKNQPAFVLSVYHIHLYLPSSLTMFLPFTI